MALHVFINTIVKALERLRRLYHQSRDVFLAYYYASVLQREGAVAGSNNSAAWRGGLPAAEFHVYLQLQWIGAGWEKITGMF